MTKQILEPLTRVEGHGRVILEHQQGRLESVQVDLNESPRLFEALLLGRNWQEVPEVVCRICGICSSVHKIAALNALEQICQVNIPPAAAIVRDLTLLGGHIQSHALHLFCLVLPDFFSVPSVLDLARDRHPLAIAGLSIKAFGNRLQEVCGGRLVHPVNLVAGGIGRIPPTEQLHQIGEELNLLRTQWPQIAKEFQDAAQYPGGTTPAGCCLATGNPTDFSLVGTALWTAGGNVQSAADYEQLLAEQPVPDSNAKRPTGEQGPFLVGALARQVLAATRACSLGERIQPDTIYANNAAQLVEIGWAFDQVHILISQLLELGATAPCRIAPGAGHAGVGVAAIEAPRGLLIHRYALDDTGAVIAADVVTPTAINQQSMATQIEHDLDGINSPEEMIRTAEQIVRAFDPCISCAVHLLEI